MNRRKFIYHSSLLGCGLVMHKNMAQSLMQIIGKKTEKMPVLFMGHGSPMNAIEDNKYTKNWRAITKDIPTPKAILVISAHWETRSKTQFFSGEKPKMIYDMYGFPAPLYEVDYPVPGNPNLAKEIVLKINRNEVVTSNEWGLDHGAWSVLTQMFPSAAIPCFQMSLNNTRDLQWHYDLGKELRYLREHGVLILGSGNIVHNLRYISQMNQPALDWALDFDHFVAEQIMNENHAALIHYEKSGSAGLISVNSAEHYIPMLYTLATKDKGEEITYYNHNVGGSLMDVFMRCIKIG